jgi:hypothetical protein
MALLAWHVTQESMIPKGLKDEFGGFFPEIHGIHWHQQKTGNAAPADHLCRHRSISRPQKRPQYEKQAHQKGERDKNDVEGFE